MTAHDYNLIAPQYGLFHNGAICERTKFDHYFRAIAHRCVKNSWVASALAATAHVVQRRLHLYRENIDTIIAPSRFLQALFIEYGIDAKKIVHIPHFIDASLYTPCEEGSYMLFVGRLSEEKGVRILIEAAAKIKNVPVHIVGTGPEEKSLKNLAEKLGATNIVFRGFVSGDELRTVYSEARSVVIPSLSYEVFGLTALAAYASGKPVIASQIGGLSEIVREKETGFLTSAGDANGLAERMSILWNDPVKCAQMGKVARAWVEQEFNPEMHYERITEVYRKNIFS